MMDQKIQLLIAVVLIAGAIMVLQKPALEVETPVATGTEGLEIGIEVGNIAPDFELNLLDGGPVRLSDYRGKVVLVNFFASWCPPCRAEMPEMNEYARQEEELVILFVNLQESDSAVRNFAQELGITQPVLMDPDAKVEGVYRSIKTQPITYFIDRDGVIRDVKFGAMVPGETQQKTAPLLEN